MCRRMLLRMMSITMMAMPGQSLHYVVNIPLDQPPGLYWYHTHPHGESYQQDLDGMSGAIVIDGIERYVPEVQHMRERILVLRDQVLDPNHPAAALALRHRVELSTKACGGSTETAEAGLHGKRCGAPANRHYAGGASVLAHGEYLT